MTQKHTPTHHPLKWEKVGRFQHWDADGWSIRRKGAWFIITSKDDVKLPWDFQIKHDRLRSAQVEIERHRRAALALAKGE